MLLKIKLDFLSLFEDIAFKGLICPEVKPVYFKRLYSKSKFAHVAQG